MIRRTIQSLCGVVAGLFVAFVLVIGTEFGSSILHPFPAGVDPSDIKACREHVARYPTGVLALAMLAWGLTVFVSSWLATRIGPGRHSAHGIAVGVILLAAASFNMAMLPYPDWFWLNVILFPVAFMLGAKAARPASPAADVDEAPSQGR